MKDETPDIKAIAERFQRWDAKVAELEAQLVDAKRLRREAREELLSTSTRHDLDD